MKKLKIGMFMDSWYPDINGVILVMENLLKQMSSYADVTLVVPKMGKIRDQKIYPFKIIEVDSIPLVIAKYRLGLVDLEYFKLKKIFDKIDFDIIHIHSPFALGKLGIRVAKEKNIPVISTMHTRWEFEFERYIKSKTIANLCVKHLIKSYNKCYSSIALNNSLIKVYDDYGYTGTYEIINNGTDMEMVSDKKKSAMRVNHMFKFKEDDIVLLFVGRITSIKNVFFLLDTLEELKKCDFKFKMLYVGDGPDFKNLSKKVSESSIKDDVILTGKIMDRELLKDIYFRADLFLFPSLFDSSSLVQIEAASQETPTLFVEGSVTSNTATNNINAFMAKENTKDFAHKIIEIFKDRKLYNKVKENAKRDLAKSWKEISDITYKYYLRVIDEFNKKKMIEN